MFWAKHRTSQPDARFSRDTAVSHTRPTSLSLLVGGIRLLWSLFRGASLGTTFFDLRSLLPMALQNCIGLSYDCSSLSGLFHTWTYRNSIKISRSYLRQIIWSFYSPSQSSTHGILYITGMIFQASIIIDWETKVQKWLKNYNKYSLTYFINWISRENVFNDFKMTRKV